MANGRVGLLLSITCRWSKAKQKKLDSDIELDLLSTELNGSYSKIKTEMQKATDPEKAALYWSEEHYEGGPFLSDGQTKASDLKRMRENGITSSRYFSRVVQPIPKHGTVEA